MVINVLGFFARYLSDKSKLVTVNNAIVINKNSSKI